MAAGDVLVELRRAGLEPTAARRAVLDALAHHAVPASALQVHATLQRRGLTIGVSTVYRTLHTLGDAGVLHEFDRAGERTYRRCTRGAHQHLLCRACGLVIESPVAATAAWFAQLATTTDFVPDPAQVTVPGLCGRCRRQHDA